MTPSVESKPKSARTQQPASVSKADDLLAGIIDIVRQTGLTGFSLDSLSRQLGTSSRMLIHYFGSKDELLGRIVYALREDHVASLDAQPVGSITEAIDLWWNHYRANLAEMQFFFHLTSRRFEEPEKFTEFSSTAVDLWVTYLYRGLQSDERSEAETLAVARLVLATVRGLVADLLITGDAEHVEESLTLFKHMLEQRSVS